MLFLAALREQEQREQEPKVVEIDQVKNEWISVKEQLPEPERQVLVLTTRNGHTIVTDGMYENGKISTEASCWCWYDLDFDYDEENDLYLIPEGWWEYKHYNGDDEHNHLIDDVVTHWMPLPEPPKEGADHE